MAIPIQKLVGLHYYVRDCERVRRWYVEHLGFVDWGRSTPELERQARQESRVLRAGDTAIICSSPLGQGGQAARYLSRHPDGLAEVIFEVEDVPHTFQRLEANGATPTSEVERFENEAGAIDTFAIATPLGETTFRFIQRRSDLPLPGMRAYDIPRAAPSELGYTQVDHLTVNLRTMRPALLWLEHVLEFQPFWGVEFHTGTAAARLNGGSGLRSKVMWDPGSGIKLACNEPLRPSFDRSQISLFCEDNRGEGFQHVALGVRDIVRAVRALSSNGVPLMPAPANYHQRLSAHLSELGIDDIAEDRRELEELGILVDGSAPDAYLLQIFLRDSSAIFGSPDAGPFFFEIIQRKGDTGFGAGNFRALFDSVEGQQLARTA